MPRRPSASSHGRQTFATASKAVAPVPRARRMDVVVACRRRGLEARIPDAPQGASGILRAAAEAAPCERFQQRVARRAQRLASIVEG
jgi:hypothetical protein